jgi:hypothetical protein
LWRRPRLKLGCGAKKRRRSLRTKIKYVTTLDDGVVGVFLSSLQPIGYYLHHHSLPSGQLAISDLLELLPKGY